MSSKFQLCRADPTVTLLIAFSPSKTKETSDCITGMNCYQGVCVVLYVEYEIRSGEVSVAAEDTRKKEECWQTFAHKARKRNDLETSKEVNNVA